MPKYTHSPLSKTNRVGRYLKKNSPTHIHPVHQISFMNFLQLLRIRGILFVQFTCLTVLFHNLCPGPLWSSSWSGTLCLMAKYMCVERKVGNSEFVCLLCRTAEPERVQRVHAVPAAHLSGVRIIPVSVL